MKSFARALFLMGLLVAVADRSSFAADQSVKRASTLLARISCSSGNFGGAYVLGENAGGFAPVVYQDLNNRGNVTIPLPTEDLGLHGLRVECIGAFEMHLEGTGSDFRSIHFKSVASFAPVNAISISYEVTDNPPVPRQ